MSVEKNRLGKIRHDKLGNKLDKIYKIKVSIQAKAFRNHSEKLFLEQIFLSYISCLVYYLKYWV